MILVADSGSTKTEWVTEHLSVITKGINPVRDTPEEIRDIIVIELMPELYCRHTPDKNIPHKEDFPFQSPPPSNLAEQITEIHFYGAGCVEPFAKNVYLSLSEAFPQADIHVYSDLLGAARALCGKEEGIACILGTGSNSCLCRNGEIIKNISPLGYILGDEGSGAVLGRTFISEMLKGDLTDLWEPFSEQYGTNVADIINNVYRQPQANRFLASIVPFIKSQTHNAAVREFVIKEFGRFLKRNVLPYDRTDLPVNFAGGVANNFPSEISAACTACGLTLGKIIAKPAKEMWLFHTYVI